MKKIILKLMVGKEKMEQDVANNLIMLKKESFFLLLFNNALKL